MFGLIKGNTHVLSFQQIHDKSKKIEEECDNLKCYFLGY